MIAQYAKSYIDQLYEAKDTIALCGVISVVCKQRQLPEQFSIFVGLLDWVYSTRSGIYQYYECMEERDISEFESLADGLARFGLGEIAARYRSGMATWRDDLCKPLDCWVEEHEGELEAAAFELIAKHRVCLYANET
jgi:hypothetical protein